MADDRTDDDALRKLVEDAESSTVAAFALSFDGVLELEFFAELDNFAPSLVDEFVPSVVEPL